MRNKKQIFSIFAIALILEASVYTKTASAQTWQTIPHPPLKNHAQFIMVHPENPNILFTGSGGELFATFDHGKNWKRLIGFGSNAKINGLHFDGKRIFLLASEGLFESKNQGKNWKKIFGGNNARESNVRSLCQDTANSKIIYLGTEAGLFQSLDAGRSWRKESNELARQEIHAIETDRDNRELFIAGEKGLYRIIPHRNQLDRVYLTRSLSREEKELIQDADEESEIELPHNSDQIQTVVVTPPQSSTLAIGTKNGVFVSEDEGNHWERLPLAGLLSTNILDLAYLHSQDTFLAATERGAFVYDPTRKHWNNLPDGFPLVRVNRLTLLTGNPEMLYTATSEGVYRVTIEPWFNHPELPRQEFSARAWNLALLLFQREPTVSRIQKETIRNANVSNWKTRRWQWASRLRMLIPDLSVGKSFSASDTVDIDRGGTNDTDRYIVGPPDQSRSWDLDLSWNLADLIWNSSQTSIDSREKSMVELRNDVLNEVTRLYFERRRAQVEFVLTPPGNELDRMNGLLRIDDLTANIDALTSGYLTKALEKIYNERPDFREIWISPKEVPK